jgi:hypothetical protein
MFVLHLVNIFSGQPVDAKYNSDIYNIVRAIAVGHSSDFKNVDPSDAQQLIYETSTRMVVGLYSHQHFYKVFQGEKNELSRQLRAYLSEALVSPRTLSILPPYYGVVYSGVSHAHYASATIGATFELDFSSFSRAINVSIRFNFMRKNDALTEPQSERKLRPFDSMSSVYVLVGTALPVDSYHQPIGRQIFDSGVYVSQCMHI